MVVLELSCLHLFDLVSIFFQNLFVVKLEISNLCQVNYLELEIFFVWEIVFGMELKLQKVKLLIFDYPLEY